MSVSKDPIRGSFYVQRKYINESGVRCKKTKRGFATRKEAEAWEANFVKRLNEDLTMAFDEFCRLYLEMQGPRLKANTLETKRHIIEKKLIPYFGKTPVCDITPAMVVKFENTLLSADFSPTYIHTICNQLSAVFNFGVRYYRLPRNPVLIAGKVGSKSPDKEMSFWTLEQFNQFIPHLEDKPESYFAFEILYWCGLREGELLALTMQDIDWREGIIRVRHSYQRINGEDVITDPKTKKSKRDVLMPDFLLWDLMDYVCSAEGLSITDRLFPMTKHKLRHEMKRGCEAAGLEPIRIHDLRHSHVSLLVNLGMNPAAIADRVGHTSVEITQTYSHMFPSTQLGLVNALNEVGGRNE